MAAASIQYSEKYFDDVYEYRCVLVSLSREGGESEREGEKLLLSSSLALAVARAPATPGAPRWQGVHAPRLRKLPRARGRCGQRAPIQRE